MSHVYPDPIQGSNSQFAKSFSYEPMPHCPQLVFNQVELRDYFAAAALQPLVTSAIELDHSKWDAAVQHAYLIADAMIKAREAKP